MQKLPSPLLPKTSFCAPYFDSSDYLFPGILNRVSGGPYILPKAVPGVTTCEKSHKQNSDYQHCQRNCFLHCILSFWFILPPAKPSALSKGCYSVLILEDYVW